MLTLNLSCELEFYGDLVYKLKKIVGSNNFSAQFIEIISHYKKMDITLMYCIRLHAKWSTQSRLATLDFRLCNGSDINTYLFDKMVEALCSGCCQAQRDLPVGFLLLRYSVLCTVESLSLLYRLFIS